MALATISVGLPVFAGDLGLAHLLNVQLCFYLSAFTEGRFQLYAGIHHLSVIKNMEDMQESALGTAMKANLCIAKP